MPTASPRSCVLKTVRAKSSLTSLTRMRGLLNQDPWRMRTCDQNYVLRRLPLGINSFHQCYLGYLHSKVGYWNFIQIATFPICAKLGRNWFDSQGRLKTNSGHSGHHLDFRFKQYCFHPHLQECISGVCRIVSVSAFHSNWTFGLCDLLIVLVMYRRKLYRHTLCTAAIRAKKQAIFVGCRCTFYSALQKYKALNRRTLLHNHFEWIVDNR